MVVLVSIGSRLIIAKSFINRCDKPCSKEFFLISSRSIVLLSNDSSYYKNGNAQRGDGQSVTDGPAHSGDPQWRSAPSSKADAKKPVKTVTLRSTECHLHIHRMCLHVHIHNCVRTSSGRPQSVFIMLMQLLVLPQMPPLCLNRYDRRRQHPVAHRLRHPHHHPHHLFASCPRLTSWRPPQRHQF